MTTYIDLDNLNEVVVETVDAPSDLIMPLLRYQKEWLSWALKQEESASRGASALELQRSSSASSSGMMGRSMNEMQIEVQRRLHEQLELKEEKSRLNAKLKNTGKELDKRKEEKKKHMVEIEKLWNDLEDLNKQLDSLQIKGQSEGGKLHLGDDQLDAYNRIKEEAEDEEAIDYPSIVLLIAHNDDGLMDISILDDLLVPILNGVVMSFGREITEKFRANEE
ncbi:hypothetical protein L6452_39111 [Arctium lappa]|uniref:Uncharacterized protein n=1 Tax=Arctium lappa TaxID=4217 RepID=A0ACB8XRL6_ARCLA|nr:hypothetical protein L6452_39111 [Arctium lappa]